MMIYKCDRCGKAKVKGSILFTQGLTLRRDIDLCSECLYGVKRWAKENISRRGRDYERND